ATVTNRTASKSGPALQVMLGATDADSDPVTFSASVTGYNPAFDVQQQYHFTGVGYLMTPDGVTAYVLTAMGSNANGNGYYLLKSDGGLYAFDGTGNYGHTFANSANLLTTLDPSVDMNPMLLPSAQAPMTPSATAAVTGNTLTVNVASAPVGTVFRVFVNASDGAETTRTSFLVTVTA